jgi:aryl-alcohol dehydrogenase-like predicted oxidoreductase
MVNRRDFLGITLGAGASLALTPQLLRALQTVPQPGGKLLQRAIPSTGEMLPVIGLGSSATFGNVARSADQAALKEVLRTLVDNGGRVFDTAPSYGGGTSEQVAGSLANELGIQTRIFWATKVNVAGFPPQGGGPAPKADPAAARAQIEASFARFKVPKIDLIQVHNLGDVPTQLAILKELKREGRVRYIGVTATSDGQYAELESIMRNEPLDFVGVDYAIDNRNVEQTILPLARERKIGVLVYLPFGRTSLFRRVGTTPLPEWAAEFDATTWAQFFLKYVISHPAVTVVTPGTSQAKNMLDNIGGGMGRLPSEATRQRMAAFIDALPAAAPAAPQAPQGAQAPGIALSAAVLDRYVGEYAAESGFTMTFRRDGATLFVKPGPNPEAPLAARSETRFADPRGPTMEFQLDGTGKVTGLVLEQGAQRIPLQRK